MPIAGIGETERREQDLGKEPVLFGKCSILET